MASSLDKVASNLCGTSWIQCNKCKGSMELINISGDYIASLGYERCRTKKTKNLDEGGLKKNFNHTSRFWGCNEKFRLMIRKGLYPYGIWMAGKNLGRQVYYRKIHFTAGLMWKLSVIKTMSMHRVWNTMEKKTLGCFHDIYLKADVLLLADLFEAFRNTYLKNYKLDPAHFSTAPGLAWQALLKTAAEYCEHEKRRKDCELCPN